MGQVLSFVRPQQPKPTTWSQITASAEELLNYCLILLQQFDGLRSGDKIHVTKEYPIAVIDRARSSLKTRGYPTTFEEGGAHDYGVLVFQ